MCCAVLCCAVLCHDVVPELVQCHDAFETGCMAAACQKLDSMNAAETHLAFT